MAKKSDDGDGGRPLPLIYIGSLRRTGSTLVAEALTLWPYSHIFQEPRLGDDAFVVMDSDQSLFEEKGIDLGGFSRSHHAAARMRVTLGIKKGFMVAKFKDELMPLLLRDLRQVGVKEIRHDFWKLYLRHFPNMRIVLTGRDPRDVYISLYNRFKSGKGGWTGEYNPERVAADLNHQFGFQKEMVGATDCLKVRYEDLCLRPDEEYARIKEFTRSPIPSIGNIGGFLSATPKRVNEHQVHKGSITSRRVQRWRWEKDAGLAREAQETFDLMDEYCRFWGFERDPEPVSGDDGE